MTAYVHFTRPVPVGGTNAREEHFSEGEGWRIAIHGSEVVLSRPAEGIRPAVPAFRVVGVGFCAKDVPPTVANIETSGGSGCGGAISAAPENIPSPPTEAPKSGGAIRRRRVKP